MSVINTEPEVRADIERLTEEMIYQCKNATSRNTLLYYMISKYHYLDTVMKLRQYKDVMIVDFPKPAYAIPPETEDRIIECISKWANAKTADLKAPYYNEAKMLCSDIERGNK